MIMKIHLKVEHKDEKLLRCLEKEITDIIDTYDDGLKLKWMDIGYFDREMPRFCGD